MRSLTAAVVITTLCLATAVDAQDAPAQASGTDAPTPASEVETILAEMQAFEAPQLGLLMAPAPHDELLVIGIRPESPAARAGLRRGDFVVKINGEDVPSVEELKARIAEGPQRESAMLTVWRGGTESQINLPLRPTEEPPAEKPRPWAGVQLDEVPEKGLVIKAVYDGGPAAQAGLQVGDAIVSVDGMQIKSFVDGEKYLQQAEPFSEANVVVERNGERRTVQVTMAALRETPQGLVLQTEAPEGDSANTSPAMQSGPGAMMLQQQRWEAEQRHRLEQLLQEIRQDLKDVKNQLATPRQEG